MRLTITDLCYVDHPIDSTSQKYKTVFVYYSFLSTIIIDFSCLVFAIFTFSMLLNQNLSSNSLPPLFDLFQHMLSCTSKPILLLVLCPYQQSPLLEAPNPQYTFKLALILAGNFAIPLIYLDILTSHPV